MTTSEPASPRRKTWQKEAVLKELASSSGFVSAQQLHQKLTLNGTVIGLATVYRTLNALVSDGLADSLVNNSGENLYRDCSKHHHHHLICNSCGVAVEIEADEAESWASKIATEHGFTDVSHIIEIFGVCGKCSAK